MTVIVWPLSKKQIYNQNGDPKKMQFANLSRNLSRGGQLHVQIAPHPETTWSGGNKDSG